MASTLPRQLLCVLIRYEQPLALLGLYWLSSRLFHLILSLPQWLSYDFPCCGQWAVVTLEDNTLSCCYAEELARRRINVALIGAEPGKEKLKEFAQNLQDKYEVRVRVLTLNLDSNQGDVLGCIANELESLDNINILVNQLPAPPLPSPHSLLSDCDLADRMKSILLMTHLTKLVARRMATCGRGHIVNISDPSGDFPQPWLAAHSAACAYMDVFSRALAWEIKCIRVQSLVAEPLARDDEPCSLLSMPAPLLARRAVDSLGQARSRGYWWYSLRAYLLSCLPLCLRMYSCYLWNRPPGCFCLEE